ELSEWMPSKFKLYGRHDKSTVYVDGTAGGKLDLLDFVDEVDPNLTADRYLYTEANTQMASLKNARSISSVSNIITTISSRNTPLSIPASSTPRGPRSIRP
ncbi:MAG TPA: hypothetical protein PLG50_14825, partial [bacterium]|nr:hypothetical protein [bacterium]